MHDQCGTPAYIAPEILRNLVYFNLNPRDMKDFQLIFGLLEVIVSLIYQRF